MPEDVKLKSLEFKRLSDWYRIGSVRVNLTHDYSSEVFQKKGESFAGEEKIDFDVNRPIKRVQSGDNNGSFDCTYGVKFMDKDGNQMSIYDPNNNMNLQPGAVHEIADNEELIGVYGVKDKERWFSAFGFIVKVRE